MLTTDSMPATAPAVDPLPYDHPTVAALVEQHGLLIQHDDVAALLGRHPGGLRDMVARRPHEPAYAVLRAARRPVGRHTLYDARVVARLIDGDDKVSA